MGHRTSKWLNVNFRPFWNVTVVIETDKTLYPLTPFDALKGILCMIAWVSFFYEIFMVTFWGWNSPFPHIETVGSHLKWLSSQVHLENAKGLGKRQTPHKKNNVKLQFDHGPRIQIRFVSYFARQTIEFQLQVSEALF